MSLLRFVNGSKRLAGRLPQRALLLARYFAGRSITRNICGSALGNPAISKPDQALPPSESDPEFHRLERIRAGVCSEMGLFRIGMRVPKSDWDSEETKLRALLKMQLMEF